MKRFKNLILIFCLMACFASCEQNNVKPAAQSSEHSNARPVGGMGSGTGDDYSNETRADVDTRREPAQNTKPSKQSRVLKE